MSTIRRALIPALTILGLATPVAAHPHIFVDARATIIFDASGAFAGIRQSWTFDKGFSAWSVQGLDTNNDGVVSTAEMQDLADQDMDGLGQYEYYTFAGEGPFDIKFAKGSDATLKYEDGQTTLDFAVAVDPPYHIQKRLELAINDPEYYVAITFAGLSAITLQNAPPGCEASLDPPKELDPALQDELYALPPDVTKLPAELEQAMKGVQGAIIVSCPPSAMAQSAAPQASNTQIRKVKTIPFNAPISTTSPANPSRGPLAAAVSSVLMAFRANANAFWVLGAFGFLYGLIRVAAPSNPAKALPAASKGTASRPMHLILFTLASAFLHAAIATVLVFAAAGILRLAGTLFGSGAAEIRPVEYALLILLGLILVVRQLIRLWGDQRWRSRSARSRARARLYDADLPDDDNGLEGEVLAPERAPRRVGALLPPPGALALLLVAVSQDAVTAGLMAILLMGLGSTLAVIVRVTLGATGSVQALAPSQRDAVSPVGWWLAFAGSVVTLSLGVVFLLASR